MTDAIPGLSVSDAGLAAALAAAPEMRHGLERLGPVPDDLTPLTEAFVVFLRHAPSGAVVPPPALGAVALVVRHTSVLWTALHETHPDLAGRLDEAVETRVPFFGVNYPWARSHCLAVAPYTDERIWPYRSEELQPSSILPYLPMALAAILLGWVFLPALVYLAVFLAMLGGALVVMAVSGLRDLWRRGRSDWRKTLPRTPEVMRLGLAHAVGVETRATQLKRNLIFGRLEFGVSAASLLLLIVQALT